MNIRTILAAALFAIAATGISSAQDMTAADYAALFAKVNNTGRWGKDDALGTLNHITPAERRQASREVRDGVTVSLARTITPGDTPGALEPSRLDGIDLKDGDIQWQAERLTLVFHGYAFSHVDALSHTAFKGAVYNATSDVKRDLVTLSVERMQGGIVSRGVLVDLTKLKGVEYLEPGTAYTPADIEAWEKKTGVTIGAGDVLLVRTGRWVRWATKGPVDPTKQQAGPHPTMAAWLHARRVAIVGDDGANDLAPSVVPGVSHPFHQAALVAMGMPLLDNLDLDALARTAETLTRWTFLFVAAPLPLKDATGSPLNPLAVF